MKNFIAVGMFTMVTLLIVSVSADAEVLTLANSKVLLNQKNQAYPMIVQPIDPANASNPEYVAQVNKINSDFKACMSPDTPPPGSPIGRFHKYKSAQLGDYCDKLTVPQCIDKVHSQQVDYCKQKVKTTSKDSHAPVAASTPVAVAAPAASQETTPSQPGNECGDAKNDLKRLTAEKSALEARKKWLETEIIRIFGELAANDAAFNKARQKAERQCGK